MTRPSDAEIARRIQAAVKDGIDRTGMFVQGVLDNPPFCYTIGLFDKFGFEIFCMGMPTEIMFDAMNHIHDRLNEGFKITDGLIVPPGWFPINLPFKFIKADHPLLEAKYMIQAHVWHGSTFPVFQLVLPDAEGRFPGDEDFDHELMDDIQQLMVAKR